MWEYANRETFRPTTLPDYERRAFRLIFKERQLGVFVDRVSHEATGAQDDSIRREHPALEYLRSTDQPGSSPEKDCASAPLMGPVLADSWIYSLTGRSKTSSPSITESGPMMILGGLL